MDEEEEEEGSWLIEDTVEEEEEPLVIGGSEYCNDAAPLVANGGMFVGCHLPDGHEGQHYIEIRWH